MANVCWYRGCELRHIVTLQHREIEDKKYYLLYSCTQLTTWILLVSCEVVERGDGGVVSVIFYIYM